MTNVWKHTFKPLVVSGPLSFRWGAKNPPPPKKKSFDSGLYTYIDFNSLDGNDNSISILKKNYMIFFLGGGVECFFYPLSLCHLWCLRVFAPRPAILFCTLIQVNIANFRRNSQVLPAISGDGSSSNAKKNFIEFYQSLYFAAKIF